MRNKKEKAQKEKGKKKRAMKEDWLKVKETQKTMLKIYEKKILPLGWSCECRFMGNVSI